MDSDDYPMTNDDLRGEYARMADGIDNALRILREWDEDRVICSFCGSSTPQHFDNCFLGQWLAEWGEE